MLDKFFKKTKEIVKKLMSYLEIKKKLPNCGDSDEKFEILRGNFIANGQSRSVWKVKGHDDYVLKESFEGKECININEAKYYYLANNEGLTKIIACLAEIHSISETGKYIIMEALDTSVSLTGKTCNVPKEVADKHKKNFGIKHGVIKCLDYGGVAVEGKISEKPIQHQFPSDEAVAEARALIDLF
ncbi:hypothetical protein EKN76_13935 [Enterobacter bugandensis]|uniref:hypothetical protein n=1 Tax=Enterobacter bugandensis TaxID=881260 RepID=UPI000F81A65D|nr:hypothetical protein [Enterobacter bugandensis]RTN93640.1 hypothetical protein EKN79_04075 [Enterobacter bugandensis]RTO13434.1 hypothetical protein EKN76_13935 [Enterobacter bugandensis]